MKKLVSLALVVMMVSALAISTFAAGTEVNFDKEKWGDNVAHVSYDEIKNYDDSSNVVISQDAAKSRAVTFEAGKEGAIFWGWVGAKKNITGFSYSINGADKVTDATFKYATEQAVVDAAKGQGGVDGSRFKVKVPLSAGTQLVRVFVDYEDGTSDMFWACEATVGQATDYTDAEANVPGDGQGSTDDKNPEQEPSNPATADVAVVVIATVATVALAGVVVSKKVKA